jgi:polysaccharide export outer membrane protein
LHLRAFQAAILVSLSAFGAAVAWAQPSYTLGPGDAISIHVFGEDDLSMEVRIGDNGKLNYPFLGELQVEGRTVDQIEQSIMTGLAGDYLVDPVVTVSILEYRPFFMHGEVKTPGGIPYQPRLTIARAIALAGGFTERASRSKIEVIRADDPSETSVQVSLTDPVYPGDIITVQQSFF